MHLQLILRHLPKNFDSVHNLTFNKDENGEPTKVCCCCLCVFVCVCVCVLTHTFLARLYDTHCSTLLYTSLMHSGKQ